MCRTEVLSLKRQNKFRAEKYSNYNEEFSRVVNSRFELGEDGISDLEGHSIDISLRNIRKNLLKNEESRRPLGPYRAYSSCRRHDGSARKEGTERRGQKNYLKKEWSKTSYIR